MGPFLYTTSTMHWMTVSLALELLAEAGFTEAAVKQIEGDPFNNYYVARKH
jgi:hypothetical protein